jgi:hypothetical protein
MSVCSFLSRVGIVNTDEQVLKTFTMIYKSRCFRYVMPTGVQRSDPFRIHTLVHFYKICTDKSKRFMI